MISICQVKNNPAAYNHKLLELTGFVSHGFEDFTFRDPICASWPEIWLEYGGKAKSGTMYCCGVTNNRHRPKELAVENIPISLLENDQFRNFDKSIQPPFRTDAQGSIVHATLIGRFFAGQQIHYPNRTVWGGYGHMGCCSLFAIQEVKAVDAQNRNDLDYDESLDPRDRGKTKCGFLILPPTDHAANDLKAQQEADEGQSNWVFNDPEQVAAIALSRLAHVDERTVVGLKQRRKAPGRIVYQWSSGKGNDTYVIVINRPYWLSYYARDSKRVAWVVAAAYRSFCGRDSQ